MRKARKLNLAGFVQNLPNGQVKAVAEGDESDLEIFRKYLEEGPIFARVDSVSVDLLPPTNEFSDFTVTDSHLIP